MAQEIDLGGTIYISSKHAAEKTGYTQDYIGQLARGGQIEAKRVSGMWYILEQSLRDYKAKADLFVPTPPQGFAPQAESEVSVSFDGKDYISTGRAAKISGYNQDYVGQLARSGEILSRQVGNRWYVDRESLLSHKKAKDDLLAAVQVESVGLAKQEQAPVAEIPSEIAISEEVTHFEYVKEESPLIPDIAPVAELDGVEDEPMPEFPRRKVAAPIFEEYRAPNTSPIAAEAPQPALHAIPIRTDVSEEVFGEPEITENPAPEVNIPIRVSAPHVEEHVYIEEDPVQPRAKRGKAATFAFAGVAVLAALGTIAYVGSSLGFLNFSSVISGVQKGQNAAVSNSVVKNSSDGVQSAIRNLFSKEIVYTRE